MRGSEENPTGGLVCWEAGLSGLNFLLFQGGPDVLLCSSAAASIKPFWVFYPWRKSQKDIVDGIELSGTGGRKEGEDTLSFRGSQTT